MALTYDPSAIRYASTQEAYGYTWTLNKIETDGAQVWKNSKGHEALVPKAANEVSQSFSAKITNGKSYGRALTSQEILDKYHKFHVWNIPEDKHHQYINGTWENLEPMLRKEAKDYIREAAFKSAGLKIDGLKIDGELLDMLADAYLKRPPK